MCKPHELGQTIYWLSAKLASADSLLAKSLIKIADYDIMHRCFAHPSKDVLQHASGNTQGFPSVLFPNEDPICPGCAEGKMTQSSFPHSNKHTETLFEKVHMDLKSLPTRSYSGYEYFLIIFDDCTSYGWIINLRLKSDASMAIKQFIAMVQTQYHSSVKQVQTDAGGEFKSWELSEFLLNLGIRTLTSVSHAHQQNSCAECFIRTIMDKAQAICLEACLPQSWWEFAVNCAIHVYNRTPIQHHNWKRLFENMERIKPDMTHLRVFGCGAYVFLLEEVRTNKLNPKSKLMTFIGYPAGTKGYLFMRSPNNVLYTAVQALFDEKLYPKCPDVCRPVFTPLTPPVGFEGESSNISPDGENVDYGGADFDIQGQVPGEPLVPPHAPAQHQTLINRPDHHRSDPTTPSSPSDDDQEGMYAPETPTCPRERSDTRIDLRYLWENYDRLTVANSPARWGILARFPTRAHIFPPIPEPERQQMPAEQPALLNPPRHLGRIRQPVILPDNVYGNCAPADILGNDSDDIFSEPSRHPRPGPSMAQKTELGTFSDLTQKSDIMAKMVWEGGA